MPSFSPFIVSPPSSASVLFFPLFSHLFDLFPFLLSLSLVLQHDFLSWFPFFDHCPLLYPPNIPSFPLSPTRLFLCCLLLFSSSLSSFNCVVSALPLSFYPDLLRLPSLISCTTFASSFSRFARLHFPLSFIHQFSTPAPPGISRVEIDEGSSCLFLFFFSVYLPFWIVQVSHKLNINASPKSFIWLLEAFILSNF